MSIKSRKLALHDWRHNSTLIGAASRQEKDASFRLSVILLEVLHIAQYPELTTGVKMLIVGAHF